MVPKFTSAIFNSDKTLRIIDESFIIDLLIVWGFAFEIRTNQKSHCIDIVKETIEQFIWHGLPYEESKNKRLFNPTEVINFMKWLDLNNQDSFWSKHAVTTGQNLVNFLNKRTMGVQGVSISDYHFCFKRTFEISAMNQNKKIRFRIPTGINASNQSNVDIRFDGREISCEPSLAFENYLQFDFEKPRFNQVDISYNCNAFLDNNIGEPKTKPKLSEEEKKIYTRPKDGLIKVTDRIKELSYFIASTDLPEIQVNKLWNWILDNLMIGAIHYHHIEADNPMEWALDHQIVDCQIGSALLISFCRALGIPARLVGGYTLYSEAPSQHYWAQIWLPECGWRSYDLLTWDLSRGGIIQEWRDIFKGKMEQRFVTEIFPRKIVGSIGIPFPLRHHRLISPTEKGVCIQFVDGNTGNLIYKDTISITQQ